MLTPVHTPPCIHRSEAAHEALTPKVEDGRIANVGEASEMKVTERLRDSLVCRRNVVRGEDFLMPRKLAEFLAEVFALL